MQWLTHVIPVLWEAKVGRPLDVRSLRPAWSTWWNPICTTDTKISQAWWCTPVIPATWEAEEGESRAPGRWRLQWAKIVPLHSSLSDRVRLCLKKKIYIYTYIYYQVDQMACKQSRLMCRSELEETLRSPSPMKVGQKRYSHKIGSTKKTRCFQHLTSWHMKTFYGININIVA